MHPMLQQPLVLLHPAARDSWARMTKERPWPGNTGENLQKRTHTLFFCRGPTLNDVSVASIMVLFRFVKKSQARPLTRKVKQQLTSETHQRAQGVTQARLESKVVGDPKVQRNGCINSSTARKE